MKRFSLSILLIVFTSIRGDIFAYNTALENADGKVVYCYNKSRESEVVYSFYYSFGSVSSQQVMFKSTTQKMTTVGAKAFYKCSCFTFVIIGNNKHLSETMLPQGKLEEYLLYILKEKVISQSRIWNC